MIPCTSDCCDASHADLVVRVAKAAEQSVPYLLCFFGVFLASWVVCGLYVWIEHLRRRM